MTRPRLVYAAAVYGVILVMVWGALTPVNAAAQQPAASDLLAAAQDAMVDAIARAERSVVAIARVRRGQAGMVASGPDSDLPFGRLRVPAVNLAPTSPEFVPSEFATGVVIDRQGHVLTNYHVLGNPNENDYYVWVQRRPYRVVDVEVPEQVRAGDPWTDLAILKIAAENLEPITFGDATPMRKGMIVIALGNPYAIARDGQASASWGILSNIRRAAPQGNQGSRLTAEPQSLHQFGTLLQTDARLELGTSGGALINLQGEMIGLTTALAALSGYEQAGGFAIPVDDAFVRTVETLKLGRIPSYGFLGVQPENLSVVRRQAGEHGTLVSYVVPGSPAERAGLKAEDVITHVDGDAVVDRNALFRELSRRPTETDVTLTLERRDPLLNRRRILTSHAVLSKKYIDSAQQAFAQVPAPLWRGLSIEYTSALPPQLLAEGAAAMDRKGCVAVLDVERDSPAWQVGLRPGEFISHVGSQRVTTPSEFFAAVEQQSGDVTLKLSAQGGESAVIVVPPLND